MGQFDKYQLGQFGLGGTGTAPATSPMGVDIKQLILKGLTSPLGIASILNLGGGVISGLVRSSKRKKLGKQLDQSVADLGSFADADVFDPNEISSYSKRSTYDEAKEFGDMIDAQLGLDTGQGQGALYSGLLGSRMKTIGENKKQSAVLKNQNQMTAKQLATQVALQKYMSV